MTSGLPVLSATPDKEQYKALMGQQVCLGQTAVTVVSYAREGRSGSYERGLKFSTTTYGGLKNAKGQFSFDHGKTWAYYDADAFKKAARGERTRIATDSRKEFAFNGIQAINRSYDPNYKWKP